MKKKDWIKFSVMMAIIVAILVVDLVTKYVFDAKLAGGESVTVIPYLFNFRIVHNYGAAWGMLAGKQVFLIVLTFIFLGIFIFYYIKEKNKSWLLNVTFGFLFAGCLGNLYDRLIFGYVRDMIEFDFWKSFPIFNFADVALSVGGCSFGCLFNYLFCQRNKSKEG